MIRTGAKVLVVGCLAAGVVVAGPDAAAPPPAAPAATLRWTAQRADVATWVPARAQTPLDMPAVPVAPPVPSKTGGPADAGSGWQPLPRVPAGELVFQQPAPLSLPKPALPKPEPVAPPRPVAPVTPVPAPVTPTPAPIAPPIIPATPVAPPAVKPVAPPAPKPAAPVPAPKPDPTPLPPPKPTPAPPARQRPLLAAEDLPPPPTPGVWSDGTGVPVPHPPATGTRYAAPPTRHGTFGSPDLAVSRDYHFLDVFAPPGLFSDGSDTVVLSEGPATDRSFVQAEYLLWWVNAGEIPPLATTSTDGGFGFLGQPGTRLLLGPGEFGPTARNGFRVRAGHWFGDVCDQPTFGLDGSLFVLGERTGRFEANSGQFPVITRPVFAPNTLVPILPGEFGEQVAAPGVATGTFQVALASQLWGADVNVRRAVCRGCGARKEWFVGYRYLNLDESLTMVETLTAAGAQTDPVGTRIRVEDRFAVDNQFHGAQVGWAAGRSLGKLDLDVRASVALGVTRQELNVSGSQVRVRPGGTPETFRGGLLAAGPNIGTFTQNEFGVVPEATVNLGYRLTPGLRAYVGYNFLYWSSVVRPGEQIDRVVDLTFVPNFPVGAAPSGQARPQPTFAQSGFWTQGIQFGLDYRW